MIVYSGSRLKGTDGDGNTQEISVVGPYQDELKIADLDQRNLLTNIIKELKILNYHMSKITDLHIERQDVEV